MSAHSIKKNTPQAVQPAGVQARQMEMMRRQLTEQQLFSSLTMLINLPRPVWHVSAFSLFNAGDSLLVHALQRSIEQSLPKGEQRLSLINRHCHQPVNAIDLQAFNLSQGVIIGGGTIPKGHQCQ